MTETPAFQQPPKIKNTDGETRRAGFELEYTGVKIEEACDIVQKIFGGAIDQTNRFLYTIRDGRFGDFQVEVDATLLKEEQYHSLLAKAGIDLSKLPEVTDVIEDLLMGIAEFAVPFEIVSPPLPVDQLADLDLLRRRLRESKALGSGASLMYAFGLHINPESPDLKTGTLLAHLQSFLLLFETLKEEAALDFTREYMSPYIEAFPESYVRKILAPDYAPDFETLLEDYLAENPTRNRPLDMLPLFAHVAGDQQRIQPALPEDQKHLINARPTYHFRMPDCRIDDPNWSIAFEWNRWLRIEKLALDDERRTAMAREYLENEDSGDWPRRMQRWLADL
ncbi:MAG: amidoligase family protein [bacterium]|nr:amidoligase family protein [bacterium]